MKIVYENNKIRFKYLEEHECIIQEWDGYVHDDNFRDANIRFLELSNEIKITRLISVTFNDIHMSKEIIDWAAQEIGTKMVENGLKYMAFVISNNPFSKIVIKRFMNQRGLDLEMNVFEWQEDALAWVTTR